MKKLAIFVLFLVFLTFPNFAFAEKVSGSSSPTPSPTIDYGLPYPGILPGSPIYPVKVLRDRLVEFFISDPLKRGEFYLLQADKHISAAQVLASQSSKNFSVAETTVSKGENYMELSLSQLPTIKALQLDDTNLLHRIITALKKHQEVIKGLEKDAPGEVRSGLEQSRERAAEMQKKAESLVPKAK